MGIYRVLGYDGRTVNYLQNIPLTLLQNSLLDSTVCVYADFSTTFYFCTSVVV